MQKLLIVAGSVLVIAGLLWPWISKLGIGRLSGDIAVEREGFSFYFPIATMIILSAILTAIGWFLRNR